MTYVSLPSTRKLCHK